MNAPGRQISIPRSNNRTRRVHAKRGSERRHPSKPGPTPPLEGGVEIIHDGSGRSKISRTFLFRVISAGVPPLRSSHLLNSPILTVCLICTLFTETLTSFKPPATPSTHSFP